LCSQLSIRWTLCDQLPAPSPALTLAQDEFKTRLDEALIYAIASDHDLLQSHEDVRSQLTVLAGTALAEEATGFDPSGLGHQSDSDVGRFVGDDTTPDSQISTELTGSTSEVSDASDTPCFTYQTELSEEEKIGNLRMIFGNFPDHTLKFELKGAGGSVEKAFEALLTRQYLEETGELPKGVDGFYAVDENARSGRCKFGHGPQKKESQLTYGQTRGSVSTSLDVNSFPSNTPFPLDLVQTDLSSH